MKKMINKKRDEGRKRGGFTLVELIVVLALLGILIAFSAGGMLGYTNYAQYKRNNESAKAVFSAAQSAMSYYKASGRLEELRKEVEGLSQSPVFVPVEAFGKEAAAGSTERENDTISYLMMSKSEETYKAIESAVQAGRAPTEEEVGEETELLFKLLSDYITDVNTYDASICVEFDATDGVVSGVLYCDRESGFSYGDAEDKLNITKRDETYRRRKGIGYYSTELSERAPEKVEDLKVEAARLVNGETLDVQWFLEKKYQYLKGEQDYVITLRDDADRKLVEITLGKGKVGLISREEGGWASVEAESVKLYNPDAPEEEPFDLTTLLDSGEHVNFHAYLLQDETADEKENYGSGIALSIDVLDSYLAEALEVRDPADPAAQEKALLSTFSARRLSYTDETGQHFGLSTDDFQKITATVSIGTTEDTENAQSTAAENVFFAAGKETGSAGGPEYEIANARHLYNVNLREKEGSENTTYKITNDFAWGGPEGLLSHGGLRTGEDGSAAWVAAKFYNQQNVYEYSMAAEGERTRYPAFPGIDELRAGSTLLSAKSDAASEEASGGEDDEEKEDDAEDADSGAKEPPYTISYLTLEPKNTDGTAPLSKVGLVRENSGTIQDLCLADVDVRGIVKKTAAMSEGGTAEENVWLSGEDVGAFSGVNSSTGILKNVETVSGYVTGGRNVGGIMGSIAAGAQVSGVKNGAEVSGIENVGGIVGLLDGYTLAPEEGTEIKNTGIVYGWELPEGTALSQFASDGTVLPESNQVTSMYIGGIAGRVANGGKLENCISVPAMQSVASEDAEGGAAAPSEEELQKYLHGNYVGGIAGYLAPGTSISNCVAGAADAAASYILGENFVGGIVGWNQGTLTADESAQTFTGTVLGRNFVGGIAGYNDGSATIGNYTTNGITVGGSNFVGGVIGLNTSAAQMTDANLSWNAAGVVGNCYVGGYAGANIIAPSGQAAVTVASNAGASAVTANGAFAGGLFGYNRIVTTAKMTALQAELQTVGQNTAGLAAADGGTAAEIGDITKMLTYADQAADGSGDGLPYVVDAVFSIDEADKNEMPDASMLIHGSAPAGGTQQLSARIFAGGVLGYNASQTELTIQDYTGTALVTANGAVSGSMLEDKYGLARKYGEGKTYSFSGGILGYVTEKTTLERCSLSSSVATAEAGTSFVGASVSAPAATYLGGLAEINEGTITDCSAAAINGAENDNVGGIVGVNGAGTVTGTGQGIRNCTVPGSAVVIGRSIAGGIAAENYGLIELNGEVAAAGGVVSAGGNASVKASLGGVAGVNRETIRVNGDSGYSGSILTAGAAYVGGIAGENRGTITGSGDAGAVFTAALGDEATAPATLGGIAGSNEGTIQNLIYSGAVTGHGNSVNQEEAYAYGGIAGVNTGNGIIVKCGLNEANISLNGSSYLGGIAGRNSGNALIRDIAPGPDSKASIISSGAFATGGIAGVNEDRATVEKLSNGSNWQIQAKLQENAVTQSGTALPVGGVIGRHTSSEGLFGLTNNAGSGAESVQTAGVLSEGEEAGGIVGEVAVAQSADSNAAVVIQDCYNYGPVQATGKAGGIIGVWASGADGSVRGCFNGQTSTPPNPDPTEELDPGDTHATVTAQNAAGAAAGIIGGFSNMTAGQTVELLSCANFGVTEGKFGAGIAVISGAQQNAAAGNDQAGQSVVKLTDCSNAGRNESGAGIAVYYSGKAGNISLKLDRCRNYGRPTETKGDDSGFAGLVACVYDESGNAVFDENSGHLQKGQVSIANSIGVADVRYPTVPGAGKNPADVSAVCDNENVYYYSTNAEFAAEKIETAGIGAAASYSTGDTLNADGTAGETRSYLKAVNTLRAGLEGEGEVFDPNAENYARDCRGNYNRLEFTLASACLKLERNEADVDVNTTPVPKVEAANNGGVLNITWKNRETGDDVLQTEENTAEDETDSEITGEPTDGASENGVVYKSVLKISLYDSREEAEKDKASSSTGEAMTPVYEMTFYGDFDSVSHNVKVDQIWMGKWARVAVTNYSYKDSYSSKSSSATGTTTIQILPELKDPELVVRLKEAGTEQPVYELDLLNKNDYLDACTLNVTVQAEELPEEPEQEPETTPEGSETGSTTEGEQSDVTEDTPTTGTTDTTTEEPAQTEARTASVQLQIPLRNADGASSFPYLLTADNLAAYSPEAQTFFASSATAKVHLSFEDVQMIPAETGQKAPSAKKTFTALTLSDEKLQGGVYKDTPTMRRSGNTVTVTLAGEAALYRAELLYNVVLDDCLIEDLVVAAARQETDGETISMTMEIPADQTDEAARARVYPLEMSGAQAKDGAKLGYLVASGLTLDELTSKYREEYVHVDETAVTQPAAIAAQEQTPVETQQSETETEASQQGNAQTSTVDSIAPVAPVAAAETQSGDDESQETPTARVTVRPVDGYSIVRGVDGTFSVYYSELMKPASPYKANVYAWEESREEQPATMSAAGAGGAGAPVAPVSQDEPESETDDGWEEETEEETEVETEIEEQTEIVLQAPQSAVLSRTWDDAGLDEDGEPRAAVSEQEFRHELVLLVDPVAGASVYFMYAGFYSDMPAGGGAPTSAPLTCGDEEFDKCFGGEWPNTMSGISYLFNDLPLEYAGKYLCVRFFVDDGNGRYSEPSNYIWFHLPKLCLESPVLTRGTATVEHMMTETSESEESLEGSTPSETEVELQQLSLSWEQEKYDTYGTEKITKVGWDDCGYTIDLYKMLGTEILADSEAYKQPTVSVNLMRGGEGGSYYLERRNTPQEEEAWKEAHKDESPMPELEDPRKVSIQSVASRANGYGEKYKTEFESDQYLKEIYECELDENALGLGLPGYSVDLTETAEGQGTRSISGVRPILQIREYMDSTFTEITKIKYTLILPDIDMVDPENPESAVPLLYTYLRYFCTHSVTVKPLVQSVFDDVQNEAILSERRQSSYLVSKDPDEERTPSDLFSYQRVLKLHTKEPNDEFYTPFDPEKEKNIFGQGYDPNNYVLLPRNCGEALVDKTDAPPAAASIAQTDDFDTLDANAAGEISFTFDENGELILDTEQEGVIDETVPTGDSFDLSADGGEIVEEDLSASENLTEAQTPGQTITEMWTEAPQTAADQSQSLPVDDSSVVPMDLETNNGEG